MEQHPSYGSTRPYAVVDGLAELAGPQHGVIELPLRMDWSQQRSYDLDRDGDRRLLYETVLNEALRPDDLRELLNGELLLRLWSRLWLPRRIRELWETRFPQLFTARVA
ncbi:hypothetical protein [Nocardia macrotermitis]|uniref:Uncharacterized protein n=1 Tax=Nocardia macrotermitis TaxID=2585198 RepID=A0A7K0DAK0_9NOCA|nr:hypothetical protein [Nocardia macrotermitis]MQY22629.1 hypothetical protein [Nocardia macrotermitis]